MGRIRYNELRENIKFLIEFLKKSEKLKKIEDPKGFVLFKIDDKANKIVLKIDIKRVADYYGIQTKDSRAYFVRKIASYFILFYGYSSVNIKVDRAIVYIFAKKRAFKK